MVMTLSIVNENELSAEVRSEIDAQIDQIISKHKNNRYEVNRLAFESATALAEGENYSNRLSNQGWLRRKWNNFTGKNAQLQGQIDSAYARAQYASQRTLQKLAEQNVMSFELITAVNNKLNASLIEVDEEFNQVYRTIATVNSVITEKLVTFFKNAKSDIIQLENRVQRLEKNVNLLNWQNSIEYQMWDGVEYTDLDDISKIVCMVRDFYDITKGNWNTSDLLLLKTAMATIDLPPRGEISYKVFIDTVCGNQKLLGKLLEGLDLRGMEEYPEYVALAAGIRKSNLLDTEEAYLVENTASIMKKHGCEISVSEIKDDMLVEYETKSARIDVNTQMNTYDFMLELLYNMEQIKSYEEYALQKKKMKEAETLFAYYDIEKVFPILKELTDYGFVKAKYLLALIYEVGYTDIPMDLEKKNRLLQECIDEGYWPAMVRSVISDSGKKDEERKDLLLSHLVDVENMANNRDEFAAYEYARSCEYFDWLGISEKPDYSTAAKLYKKSPLALAKYNLAWLYYAGKGVEEDRNHAFSLLFQAAEYGIGKAEEYISSCYRYGDGVERNVNEMLRWLEKAGLHCNSHALNYMGLLYMWGENGYERNFDKAIQLCQKAWEYGREVAYYWIGYIYLNSGYEGADERKAIYYYEIGANAGCWLCYEGLGECYQAGIGVEKDVKKAIEMYEKSAAIYEKNYTAYYKLGMCYYNNDGISQDLDKAKRYFQKAAELGSTGAKEFLKEKYGIQTL